MQANFNWHDFYKFKQIRIDHEEKNSCDKINALKHPKQKGAFNRHNL